MEHKHGVFDSDTRFTINSTTRQIKNDSNKKIVLIQNDHMSEVFTFECDKTVEGHSMEQCNQVEVHFLNVTRDGKEQKSGLYTVKDFRAEADKVVCSWVIDRNATGLVGSLNFMLVFKCVENGIITYAWHTAIYEGISIGKAINADESFESDYVDVIERWKAKVMAHFTADLTEWKATTAAEIREEAFEDIATERKRIDLLSNYVTPQMFGAKGDGVTDDTEAIQKSLAHNEVYIPDGTYMISAPLLVDDTLHLLGGVNTVIKASTAMDCILKNDVNVSFVNQNISIKNIMLDGNHFADKGLCLQKISMEHYAAVDGLKVRNCVTEGIHLYLCQTSAFYNIRVTDCGNGILIDGCNNAKFYNLSACSNAGYGVKVNAVTGGSGGVSIFGIHAEQNAGDGLILNNLNSTASVYGGWIEENGGHGLYINKSMAYVTGLTVTGTGKNNNRWLYLVGNLATVENCFRARSAGDTSWVDAYVEGDSIVGNINNFQGIEANTLVARESFSDMLTNGNCEKATGWTGSSTVLTHQSTENVHSGNGSLKAVASASGASTHQIITGLNVGSIYHFVGYVYSVDVSRLRVYFKYANNANTSTNKFYYDIPDGDWVIGAWVPIDFYFRAKDNSYDVHVQCVGSGGTYYMDDFSIKEYVPEARSIQKIGNVNSYVYQIPVLADY